MEEFKGDKRTKAYKEWKKKFEEEQASKPEGVGDVVENVLNSKPLKPVTDAIKGVLFKNGKDCGCDKKKKDLNQLYPFDKPKCLEEDEYNYLTEFFKTKRTKVSFTQIQEIYEIYNRVFNKNLENTTCPSCISSVLRKLEGVLKVY